MPPPSSHVEQYANVYLAQILQALGIPAEAEVSGRVDRKHPDILIKLSDLDIVLEAEYANRRGAAKDADARLRNDSPPRIIGAISYSPRFKTDFARAVKADAPLDFAFKRAGDGAGGWQARWRTGTIYDLAQLLRRPHAIGRPLHDEVQEAVADIRGVLKSFVNRSCDKPGANYEIAKLLQASLPAADKEQEVVVEKSLYLAGLIIIGAFLFQFALFSKKIKGVKSPDSFDSIKHYADHIYEHWRYILTEINYAAIFRIAHDIMLYGNVDKISAIEFIKVARRVQPIARDGVDLMGVVYHELLAELAKPLGAYYTTIPAATMLAALALSPQQRGATAWEKDISGFRIGDLACGSGTLLAAAGGQVRDNVMRAYVRNIFASLQIGAPIKNPLEETQRTLLENVIWGYDVLDAAVHLTATTLGLMSPEVDFRKSHIYRAAVGVNEQARVLTGSFQLLESQQVSRVLFGKEDELITQVETGEESSESLPMLDLCIMNPPFVVGRKNAPSYSFLPEEQIGAVRNKMNQLAKTHQFSNAGLGPGFVALGEKYIKPGGRMAFIMSTTISSGRGMGWSIARERIESSCDLEHFIISRESGRPNFSYNTNLQECMFIARKRENGEQPKERAMFSVLSTNPEDVNQAHATVRAIVDAEQSGEEWGKLRIDGREIGEFARLRYRDKGTWDGIAFVNLRLTAAVDTLSAEGILPIYSLKKSRLVLRRLGQLATFGSYSLGRHTDDPSIREEKNRFLTFSNAKTSYAGYYPGRLRRQTATRQKDINVIVESPNCYLSPFPNCEKRTKTFFASAGRVLLNRSFRFNTMHRLASLISAPVQADNFIPISVNNKHLSEYREKALTLWLNSTPAIALIAIYAVYCEGAKVMLSLQAIKNMPVLDLDSLSDKQIKLLARAFDKIATMKFMSLPEMCEDPARIAIDQALGDVLNLHDFDWTALRAALAAEPVIVGK